MQRSWWATWQTWWMPSSATRSLTRRGLPSLARIPTRQFSCNTKEPESMWIPRVAWNSGVQIGGSSGRTSKPPRGAPIRCIQISRGSGTMGILAQAGVSKAHVICLVPQDLRWYDMSQGPLCYCHSLKPIWLQILIKASLATMSTWLKQSTSHHQNRHLAQNSIHYLSPLHIVGLFQPDYPI